MKAFEVLFTLGESKFKRKVMANNEAHAIIVLKEQIKIVKVKPAPRDFFNDMMDILYTKK